MLTWIREGLQSASVDPSHARKFEMAAEEALMNIINHAYKQRSGEIRLRFHFLKDEIELTIEDDGMPFNPLLEQPLLTTGPLEERKEGGLGIHFMRHIADALRYERIGKKNFLTLIYKKK